MHAKSLKGESLVQSSGFPAATKPARKSSSQNVAVPLIRSVSSLRTRRNPEASSSFRTWATTSASRLVAPSEPSKAAQALKGAGPGLLPAQHLQDSGQRAVPVGQHPEAGAGLGQVHNVDEEQDDVAVAKDVHVRPDLIGPTTDVPGVVQRGALQLLHLLHCPAQRRAASSGGTNPSASSHCQWRS